MDKQFVFISITSISLFFYFISLIINQQQATDIFGLNVLNTFVVHKYVWNLVTSSFYEVNIVKVLVDISFLYFVTNNLQAFVTDQFVIYQLVCIISSTFFTSVNDIFFVILTQF